MFSYICIDIKLKVEYYVIWVFIGCLKFVGIPNILFSKPTQKELIENKTCFLSDFVNLQASTIHNPANINMFIYSNTTI